MIRKPHARRAIFLLGSLLTVCAASGAVTDTMLLGRWWNSDATLVVDVATCGAALCRRVVHAARAQQEKARKADVPQMLGLSVMRDFRGPGVGHGLRSRA